MTTVDDAAPTATMTPEQRDLIAADVAWDIDSILDGRTVDDLFDEADALASELTVLRGTVADLDADGLVTAMRTLERIGEPRARTLRC